MYYRAAGVAQANVRIIATRATAVFRRVVLVGGAGAAAINGAGGAVAWRSWLAVSPGKAHSDVPACRVAFAIILIFCLNRVGDRRRQRGGGVAVVGGGVG